MSQQAETVSLTTLTANVETVWTQGIAGVGRTDLQSYNPIGYNPIYGTWEVDVFNKQVDLAFSVPGSAPTTLDMPILVVHNYTGTASPTHILLDGIALTANHDYFTKLRPSATELWVTLNRQLAGTHTLQITDATAYRLSLPLVLR